MPIFGLKDRVVLVTGGNNPIGIGAATARVFAAERSKVFIHCFRVPNIPDLTVESKETGIDFYHKMQAKSAHEVTESIRKDGGQVESSEADLSDPTAIPLLFDKIEEAFGPVEVLVNNAAHSKSDTFIPSSNLMENAISAGGEPTFSLTAESHDAHFAVNSRAVALMMTEFARRHIERKSNWGRIINVSTDGASGFTGEISYGASKHAMESYSRAAADELGQYGITINVVSPGPIQTGYITAQNEKEWASRIPLRRIGRPEDVADVILFLASDQARWVTGQLIYVGGGSQMPL